MEGWQVGLIAVVVIGLVVIAFGALRDRRLNRRRRQEMLAPPRRSIPKFSPDAPTPNYLSELQARRRPVDAQPTELTDEERARLRRAVQQPGVTTVNAGYASTGLITDPVTGWSVLQHPDVLVSSEPVSSIRELLGILERQLPTGRPLVLVAPAIGPELISTFEVNHIQQIITVLPVLATESTLAEVAAATGASPMSRTDLQSGFAVPELLGSCTTWISTPTSSHLITDLADTDDAGEAVDPAG